MLGGSGSGGSGAGSGPGFGGAGSGPGGGPGAGAGGRGCGGTRRTVCMLLRRATQRAPARARCPRPAWRARPAPAGGWRVPLWV